MDIQARQLTTEEKVEVDYFFQNSAVPPWGAVVHMDFGDVVIFDGADGFRRYTLISGADAPALAAQINQATYTSPDSGLIALVDDITARAVALGTSLVKVAAVGAVIALLVIYAPQIKRILP